MNINLDSLARRADTEGIYTVESETRGLMYFYDKGEYVIITPNGFLRLSEYKLQIMLRELSEMMKDIEDFNRMGVKKIPYAENFL